MTEVEWSRFGGRLLEYISNCWSSIVKTDYEIDLDMPLGDVINELQQKSSIEELSPQLKRVAEQFEREFYKE